MSKKNPIRGSQFAEDLKTIAEDAVNENIMPGLLRIFGDIGHNAVDTLLYHGKKPRTTKNLTSYSSASYRDYSASSKNPNRYEKSASRIETPVGTILMDDLYLESKGDADMIIDQMRDVLGDYPVVTVSDMQEFLKNLVSEYDERNPTRLHPKFTDPGYGWDNLANAKSVRIEGGYYTLALPKPKKL